MLPTRATAVMGQGDGRQAGGRTPLSSARRMAVFQVDEGNRLARKRDQRVKRPEKVSEAN